MTRRLLGVALALACALVTTPAFAKHHHQHRTPHKVTRIHVAESTGCVMMNEGRTVCGGSNQAVSESPRAFAAYEGSDPRPSPECAWWLRRYLGIPKSAFPPYGWNLARNFAGLGSPASKGCIGCVAVFSRGNHGGHVGLVEGWDADGDPIILSNLGHGTITTQPHPKARLIALRWVDGRVASR